MADPSIFVQRGQNDVGNSGGTDTSFTSVSALTAAFETNKNNRGMQAGSTTSAANHEIDDMSGMIELTGTGTLTFSRESGSIANNNRFDWEITEYVGPASGANEFIVRSRNTFSFTAPGPATAQSLDNTPDDIDRCIPIITGAMSSATTDSATNATPIAWINSSGELECDCGGSGGTTQVQVVVVEFTGSNWSVYHGDSGTTSADSGTITLSFESDGSNTSPGPHISDWTTAVIFGSVKGDDDVTDDAISDVHAVYYPNDASSVTYQFDANRDGTDNRHFIHVLQHDDMVVTRFTDTQNTQGAMNVDITSAGLTDLTQSMVVMTRHSSGTGTAYGRGWANARLTSLTNCERWAHRSGNTIESRIQVVDFTGLTDATGPTISSVTPTEFDFNEASVVISGSTFGTNSGSPSSRVYLSDTTVVGASPGAFVDISDAVVTGSPTGWTDTEITLDLSTLGAGTVAELDALGPGQRYLIVVDETGAESASSALTVHRAIAWNMSASSNITASGEDTTPQLATPGSPAIFTIDARH